MKGKHILMLMNVFKKVYFKLKSIKTTPSNLFTVLLNKNLT